jgi:hypothetical protein
MRRLASIIVLAIAVVALVGVPVAAHGRGHDGSRHARVPSFSVLVGSARQGGTMLIAAKVSPPRWHRAWKRSMTSRLAATAVVHFASGDVEVTLAPRTARARFKAWAAGRGYPGLGRQAARGTRVWGRPFWAPGSWRNDWTVFAKVPVAADETVGRVAIEVSITYGDTTATITTFGKVKSAKATPKPTPTPEPTPVSEARARR